MEKLNLKPNTLRNSRVPTKKRTKKMDPKPQCILKMQGEYLKRLNPTDTFIRYQEEQLNRIYKSYTIALKKPHFSRCEMIEVKLQSATTPSNIYVSKATDIDSINQFHHKLDDAYKANETDIILVPNVDEICCALTEKKGWQRCRILCLHMNETCTVQLIDIGHKERIKWSNLRMLDENTFTEKPPAVKCSLVQIQNINEPIEHFSIQQLNKFHAVIQKQKFFYIFVSRVEPKWCGVILYVQHSDGSFKCLNKMFPNEEQSGDEEQSKTTYAQDSNAVATKRPTNGIAVQNEQLKPTKKGVKVEMSDREGVVLLHFESIDGIFICLEQQYRFWDTFHSAIQMVEMQRSDEEIPQIAEWRLGDHCLAPDYINERCQWYRGRIVSIDDDIALVYLRDIGKTIKTTIFLLRSINAEIMKMPIFARKSSLAGITASPNETMETIRKTIFEMIETFDGLAASGYGLNTSDKSLILWGVNKFNEDPYAPTQFEYININKKLAKLGLVVATTSFKDASVFHTDRDRQKVIERKIGKGEEVNNNNDTNPSYSICKNICNVNKWPESQRFQNKEFVGFPMYINSKFVIFLLDDERKGLADKMSDVLTQRYKKSELQRFDFYLWQKGSPCFAPFEDQFHRATIRKVYNDDTVVVRFIDYGNAEKIHTTEIKKADMFGDIPILARPYYLHNVKTIDGLKWSKEVLKFVDATILEKQCNIQVVKCNQTSDDLEECNIEIFTKDKTLQMALFTRKLAIAAHEECN